MPLSRESSNTSREPSLMELVFTYIAYTPVVVMLVWRKRREEWNCRDIDDRRQAYTDVVVMVVALIMRSLPYWMAELIVSCPVRVLFSMEPVEPPKKDAPIVTAEVATTLRSATELPVLMFMAAVKLMVEAVESVNHTWTPNRGSLSMLLVNVTPPSYLHPEML